MVNILTSSMIEITFYIIYMDHSKEGAHFSQGHLKKEKYIMVNEYNKVVHYGGHLRGMNPPWFPL